MRSKYFYIKIFGIVFLILSVVIYFLLYFVPSVKSINKYRRQLKDTNLKIADFMKVENHFSFSSHQEEDYFTNAEQELKGKIPEISSREDFIALFTNIANDLQNRAKQDGIFNVLLKSDSDELQVDASSLSSDKKTLSDLLSYSSQRLSRLRKEREMHSTRTQPRGANTPNPSNAPTGQLTDLVPDVQYQTITLSFTGDLKNALNFINHIPWSSHYLGENKILISTGSIFPYYIVFLRVYYLDRRGESPAERMGGR